MILNDYDVKDFIESHNVQIDTLKDELNEHLKKSSILRTDNQKCQVSGICKISIM